MGKQGASYGDLDSSALKLSKSGSRPQRIDLVPVCANLQEAFSGKLDEISTGSLTPKIVKIFAGLVRGCSHLRSLRLHQQVVL